MKDLCNECYFNIFQNSYIGILILDKEMEIKALNSAFLNILNLQEEEVLNKKFSNFIDKNYEDIFLSAFDGLLKDESFTFNIELELKTKNMTWIDVHTSALKKSEFFVIFIDNITEKKLLQLQNREKEYMLIQQSRLAQMGEMLSMITHQWKQPLNNINLTILDLELKKEFDGLSDSCLNEAIGAIQNQVHNMSSIINTFTNFLKPNREKIEFNLYSSIKNIFDVMQIQLKLKSINYTLNIDDDNLKIFGNESEFEQVIMNLIANSRDAFEEKSGEKKIEVFLSDKNEKIELIFRDNAGGIAGNIIENIFNPYFSTKKQGTGIGLYMSKLIIEKHFNGTIEAKNIGNGVEFIIPNLPKI